VDSKEREALEALTKRIVAVFVASPEAAFVSEAAQLALVILASDYSSLCREFANAIAKGTIDYNALDLRLLFKFALLLRQRDSMS
jgi:hypothetical protein